MSLKSIIGFGSRINLLPKVLVTAQVRYKRPNTKRDRTHYERDLVKSLTKPSFPKRWQYLPIEELCGTAILKKHMQVKKPVEPLKAILAKEFQDVMFDAKLVIIFHAHPCSKEQLYDLRIALNKISLTYLYGSQTTINLALQDTSYESLLRLFSAKCHVFYGNEANFAKLLKIVKKFPIVALIGGVYEDRILSVSEFELLAKTPNIEDHLAQLCGLLSLTAQNLSSNLTRHQSELSHSLQRYVSENSEDKSETS